MRQVIRWTVRLFLGSLMGAWMLGIPGSILEAQQALPHPSLLVLAKHDDSLSIVDPQTLKVLAKVPVGGNPHEVIASPDGRTAWVTNYGNGSLNTIHVVDLVHRRIERVIDLGPLWGPHGLAVSSGKVWFTAEREKLIAWLNPSTQSVDWLLGTGQTGTHMLWVAPDGSQIVTVNVGSGTMDLFVRRPVGPTAQAGGPPSKAGGTTTRGPGGPPAPGWDQTIVKVGGLPEGFDVIPAQNGHARTIWVANAKEGTVSVIDFASGKVVDTIAAGVPTANRLRFTPDHRLALISREKSGQLTILNVASRKVIQRVLIGTGAAGVLIEPSGRRAYISCSPDNKVIVFDLHSMRVTGTILPGQEPDGLAWAVNPS